MRVSRVCAVVRLKHTEKSASRSRRVTQIFEKLSCGIVVVEGKHDVAKLSALGIKAVSYRAIDKKQVKGSKAYVLTDRDRSGEEKREKAVAELYEAGAKSVDVNMGMSLLKMLNVTSVEQVLGPIEEIFEEGNR